MRPTEKRTDGSGVETALPFESTEREEPSLKEKAVDASREYVYAPLAILWEDWRARFGLLVIVLYGLMGTVGVMVIDPSATHEGPRLLGPFSPQYTHHWLGLSDFTLAIGGLSWTYTGIWKYPFGTDMLGRDLFAMIVHATPPMLKMVIAGGVFTTAVATVVGTVAGYKGGTVDRVMMTLSDVAMTIPGLPLVIVIVVILKPQSPIMIGVLLTINAWAGLARSLRSEVLSLRENSYVEAARVMGVPTPVIIFEDIIPNLMPFIMVNFVGAARGVIFGSVGLYFLGILPSSNPNWGVILNRAYTNGGALYTWDAVHWLLFPMITIVLLSYGLILFAQGTDRIFNPRIRAKHANSDTDAEEATDEDDLKTTVTGQI